MRRRLFVDFPPRYDSAMTYPMLTTILAALAIALTPCAAAPGAPAGKTSAVQSDHYFDSRGVRLHGRLFTPAGRGPFPTAVYVTGGGKYSLLTDAYALNTVRAFNERGIAVYVFDKPGLGQSGGTFEVANIRGKTQDTIAALDLMRMLPQVDQNCMIVWALSAAGWYAPQAIEGRKDVCGFILVSPAGASPIDWQGDVLLRRELVRAGVTDRAAQDEAISLWAALWRYQGTAENYEAVRAQFKRAVRQPWYRAAFGTQQWQGLPETVDGLLAPDALRRAWETSPADYEWQRDTANFQDYTEAYRSVRQPVLLIFGGIDNLIDPPASRAIFERVWVTRTDVIITMYGGAGHGIQARGDPEHPTPAYLQQITGWAAARFAAPRDK
jgi:pimeloyl-ACP methyl ester carboxylesterase